MFNFNTDLAVERNDIYRKANNIENNIEGIETEEETIDEKIKISRVKIVNDKGAEALGKPIGTYITVDIKSLKIADNDEIQKGAQTVTKELRPLIEKHIDEKGDILVVGLGNAYVTPDSLRAKSCKRHRYNKTSFKICSSVYRPKHKTSNSNSTRCTWNNWN